MISLVPAFTGMLTLALLPSKGYMWLRWGMYLMTVFGSLPGLLIWTFMPSNVAGRTKKSVTATVLFIAYCVGNAIGAQVFQDKDAPRYIPGIIVCASMYGLEFTLMGCWRTYCKWKSKVTAICHGLMDNLQMYGKTGDGQRRLPRWKLAQRRVPVWDV